MVDLNARVAHRLLAVCLGAGALSCEKVNPQFGENTEGGSDGGSTGGSATSVDTVDPTDPTATTGGTVTSDGSDTATSTTTGGPTASTSGDPDPCNADGDCGPAAPLCGPAGCQDGSEGDPCSELADCDTAASICSSSSTCQDGGEGDACGQKSDCGSGLLCASTCTVCEVVADVDVIADLTHTWIGDHVIKLVSPSGSVQTLVSIAGGNEMADDGDMSPGELGYASNIDGPVTFDDDAEVSSELMGDGLGDDEVICVDSEVCEFYSSGFEDTEFNLTNFNGQSAAGDWMLCLGDAFFGDTMTLNAWQLVLTCDSGSSTLDSGPVGLTVPDQSYDGTVPSMTCSTITF